MSGRKSAQASRPIKVAMVAMDCVLVALAPILVQLSKDSKGAYAYSPLSINFLVEALKVIAAFITLLVVAPKRQGPPMTRSVRAFAREAVHCRLLFVPAALYAVNNYLKFVMQLFFKPTAAKMIGNLKVFAIAMLMRFVLRRRFSVLQWEALFLLVAGISINQLSNCSAGAQTFDVSPAAALVTLGTVTVPAMASVYNEYGFKKDMDTSVHIQNFFLYFYGFLVNAVGVLASWALARRGSAALFSGINGWVLLLVAINAAQGSLASFFYKFADTILKKYSSTLATIFTGIMSAVFFGHTITANFCLGISIVFISMHQFFTDGARKSVHDGTGNAKIHASPSMDHIKDVPALSRSSSLNGSFAERERLLARPGLPPLPPLLPR